jgi:hypothetical protein
MRPENQALRFLLLVCLILSAAKCRRAQPFPEPAFTLKAVGPNAWAAIDRHQAEAPNGANAGFVIGEDSVAVIDTFPSREAAKQLLDQVHKLTKLPVRFVINTHHHLRPRRGKWHFRGHRRGGAGTTECTRLDSLGDPQNDDDRRSGRQRHQTGGKGARSGIRATDGRL